jgi:hypothetical protein
MAGVKETDEFATSKQRFHDRVLSGQFSAAAQHLIN